MWNAWSIDKVVLANRLGISQFIFILYQKCNVICVSDCYCWTAGRVEYIMNG